VGGAVPAWTSIAAWWLGVPYVAVVAAFGVPIGLMLVTLSARRIVGPDWVATMVVLIVVAPAIAGAVLGIAFLAIAFLAAVSGEPVAAAGGLLAVLVSLVAAELIGVPVTRAGRAGHGRPPAAARRAGSRSRDADRGVSGDRRGRRRARDLPRSWPIRGTPRRGLRSLGVDGSVGIDAGRVGGRGT
jgi:hypothetical protein